MFLQKQVLFMERNTLKKASLTHILLTVASGIGVVESYTLRVPRRRFIFGSKNFTALVLL